MIITISAEYKGWRSSRAVTEIEIATQSDLTVSQALLREYTICKAEVYKAERDYRESK